MENLYSKVGISAVYFVTTKNNQEQFPEEKAIHKYSTLALVAAVTTVYPVSFPDPLEGLGTRLLSTKSSLFFCFDSKDALHST